MKKKMSASDLVVNRYQYSSSSVGCSDVQQKF